MTKRVSRKWNKKNSRRKIVHDRYAIEPKPFFASQVVDDPFRPVCPMSRIIETAHETARIHSCPVFRSENVNFCIRKVWQTTSMIQVQMGQHNVLYVLDCESQFNDLARSRFLDVTRDSQ